MNKGIFRSLKILLVFAVITGIGYPFFMTVLAQIFFPFQASGSIIKQNDKAIGSAVIGQQFFGKNYFHGRPSAVDYNAAASGALNWGPTNRKLVNVVKERVDFVRQNNLVEKEAFIPADLVLASASGLDPHISFESAVLQASRIAAVRKISKEQVIELIDQHRELPQFGLLGAERVNVLKLNLALDMMEEKHAR